MKFYILFIICFLSVIGSVFAQGDYAVLVQESPVGAGEIKPGIGVHTFGVNETVTLTTVPKPGYRFVYWLGDVSDPTTNRTMLAVDGPKIVIAVFERDEYEMLSNAQQVSSGPPVLMPRHDALGSGSVSGITYDPPSSPPPSPPPPPEPVPEPQTLALLSAGAYLWRKKLRTKLKIENKYRIETARTT